MPIWTLYANVSEHSVCSIFIGGSYLPTYEDGTECSEILAYKIQTPGNYPEESTQHGRQKIVHKMLASITWLQSVLNFFPSRILTVKFAPKYLNSSTLSKELLSNFVLWFRLAFWSRDMTMYIVLLAFTSSPFSLLATTKSSVFFFIVHILPPIY